MSFWTTERIEFMIAQRMLGKSGAEIEKAFLEVRGEKASRNAIVGKLNRLGVPSPRRAGAVSQTPIRAPIDPARYTPRPATVSSPSPVTADGCKWPIGDPLSEDYRSCGRPTQDGRSYCTEHHNIAHPPRKPRQGRGTFRPFPITAGKLKQY